MMLLQSTILERKPAAQCIGADCTGESSQPSAAVDPQVRIMKNTEDCSTITKKIQGEIYQH
jgi:hypothetical protein